MRISIKKNHKKVYALYLAVAFFFTVFSFGNLAYAETLLYNNHWTSTGQGGPFNAGGFGDNGTRTIGEYLDPSATYSNINAIKFRIVCESATSCSNVAGNHWVTNVFETTDGTTLGSLVATSLTIGSGDIMTYNSGTWTNQQNGYSSTNIADSQLYVQFDFSPFTIDDAKKYIILVSWDGTYNSGSNQTAIMYQTNAGGGRWINDSTPNTGDIVNVSGSHSSGYALFSDATPETFPPNYTTRIDTLTYATSTRIANITGYINATTTQGVYERLTFWQDSTTLGQESYTTWIATSTAGYEDGTTPTGAIDEYWLTAGTFNIDVEFLGLPTPASTSTPILSPYTLNAQIHRINNNYYDPFGMNGLDQSLYSTLLASKLVTVSTLTYNLPDLSTPRGQYEIQEFECSLTAMTGCIKNAFVWLFYPSPNSVEQFKSLNTDLQGKFPFAYAYQAPTLVSKLFTSSQTASSTVSVNVNNFGNITFLSASMMSAVPYASTVRTIIGWILWILVIEYIYYRVIRSHDQNTPA